MNLRMRMLKDSGTLLRPFNSIYDSPGSGSSLFGDYPYLCPFLLRCNPEHFQLFALEFELHELAVFFTEHDRFALIKNCDLGGISPSVAQRRSG
jgi:hypothetical protein